MAAVDASPRPEHIDPNSESRNPPSTPQQSFSSSENPNLNSLPNPNPNGSLNNPSTPVQSAATPIAPSYASPYLPRGAPQFVNPNPSFQMSQAAALQPPGVGSPAIAGSPVASSVRPVGMYQSVPGQPQVQFQYGQVQNGYMAAGAIPPPGVPRYPGQYPGLIRPGFAPRPIPPMLRPTIPGIRPGPTPPIMTPLMRPIAPIPLVEKPQTTVYVGKIAPTVDNDFLLTLLKLCGPVKSWKRAQDPSDGKPKGFGFCEFEAAEGVLRALRLLSKLNLDGQELVLNINQATRDYLEKYVEKKTEREKVKESEEGQTTTEESKKESQEDSSSKEEDKDKKDEAQRFGIVNEEDKNADKEAVDKINSMLEERVKILPPPPPLPINNAESANNLGKNQNEIVNRFKDGDSDLELKRSGEKNSEDNEVEASSARSRRERSRERERERNTRDKDREADRYERERERDRMKRDREREDRVRQSDRVLKDKLKEWENREREKEYQKHHERDREKERERERKRELLKQEEEYEDEININESRKRRRNNRGGFNNNNNVEERKRKRQREKEREEDVSDRLKEEEEREEEIKREKELERERLLREEEREKEREREKENEEHIKREMYVKDMMYGPKLVDERESVERRESLDPMQVDIDKYNNYNNDDDNNINNNNSNGEIKEVGQENNNIEVPKKLGFGLFGSGKKTSVPSVFKQEEDEEKEDKKMRPLVPIDYSAEELQAISQNNNDINNKEQGKNNNNNNNNVGASEFAKKDKRETKKVLDAKQLIDMIPKTKEELFSYEINWTIYDKHELNERMRPWISKKIMEFLGEEEETLVDYIVSCTKDHVEASKLLELLQAILDEEAEMFVLKMWRMLIFEIKKVETGLVKIK